MKRQQFNDEFKRESVRLASQLRICKTGVSKDLGINTDMLRRWRLEQEGAAEIKNESVSSLELF
jgi:transposase-like protein